METPRPSRWHRVSATRSAQLRRMFAVGAGVGIGVALVSLPIVGVPHGEEAWLVRVSLLLPAIVYVGWLLVGPALRTDESLTTEHTVDTATIEDRIDQIETVFDEAAVPRARRERPVLDEDSPRRREFRASIRRDVPEAELDPAAFGIRRPQVPAQRTSGTDA